MISVILKKEFTEYRRDGRILGMAGLVVLLLVVSLMTGWSSYTQQHHHAVQAQQDDQAVFLNQGKKTPHAAAHFGRIAYKPLAPLAVFDSGAAPYLGQAIWLEAHTRDPAMFRPAEDAPDLRRFADLSVAGILTLVLPLLIFMLGYGVFAAERDRGTLRQVLSTGPGITSLFVGKLSAVAVVGIVFSLVAIVVSAALALMSPSADSTDLITRAMWLVTGYSVYSLGLAAIALWVSARARSATSALLVLLSLWAVGIVVLPRIAASVANHVYPTPDSGAFWSESADAVRAARPDRDSDEFLAVQREVLSRALGRELAANEAASMDVNRMGLNLEVSEILGARAYRETYGSLYSAYDRQQRLRRFLSLLSPAIALQQLSRAIAGTDVASHRHFADEAEKQRRRIIRAMNEDMMINGAGQSYYYLADADFWASIPDFGYQPPPVSFALRSAIWDFLLLAAWAGLAFGFSCRAVRRLSVA